MLSNPPKHQIFSLTVMGKSAIIIVRKERDTDG